jgi:putative phosphoesterase
VESERAEVVNLEAARVGLISDTHNMLRPQVLEVFKDVDVILHAGDVGDDDILDELTAIAPVYAVRGNTDPFENARLPDSRELMISGVRVHVSHGHEVGAKPIALLAAYGHADVIVYGHTHRELLMDADGVLVVNPGAAGARRFDLMPCVAIMTIAAGKPSIELVRLPS